MVHSRGHGVAEHHSEYARIATEFDAAVTGSHAQLGFGGRSCESDVACSSHGQAVPVSLRSGHCAARRGKTHRESKETAKEIEESVESDVTAKGNPRVTNIAAVYQRQQWHVHETGEAELRLHEGGVHQEGATIETGAGQSIDEESETCVCPRGIWRHQLRIPIESNRNRHETSRENERTRSHLTGRAAATTATATECVATDSRIGSTDATPTNSSGSDPANYGPHTVRCRWAAIDHSIRRSATNSKRTTARGFGQ